MLGVFFPGKPFLTAIQHDGPRRCAQARGAISEDGSGGGASQETVRERGKGSTEGSGPRRQRLFLRHLACTRPLTRTFFFSSRIRRERERERERERVRARASRSSTRTHPPSLVQATHHLRYTTVCRRTIGCREIQKHFRP